MYFDSELTSARANSGLFNLSEVQPTSFANEFFRCNFADPTPEDPNPCFLRLNTTDPNWTLPSSVSSVEITVTWAFNDQLSNPCCVSDPMETASYPQQGVAVGVRDLLFKQIFNARNEPCPDAFITDSIDVTTEGWTFNGNECEIVGGAFCETNAIRVTLGSCSITPGSSLLSAMTQDSTSRVVRAPIRMLSLFRFFTRLTLTTYRLSHALRKEIREYHILAPLETSHSLLLATCWQLGFRGSDWEFSSPSQPHLGRSRCRSTSAGAVYRFDSLPSASMQTRLMATVVISSF